MRIERVKRRIVTLRRRTWSKTASTLVQRAIEGDNKVRLAIAKRITDLNTRKRCTRRTGVSRYKNNVLSQSQTRKTLHRHTHA